MKVKELIAELAKMDGELDVMLFEQEVAQYFKVSGVGKSFFLPLEGAFYWTNTDDRWRELGAGSDGVIAAVILS